MLEVENQNCKIGNSLTELLGWEMTSCIVILITYENKYLTCKEGNEYT